MMSVLLIVVVLLAVVYGGVGLFKALSVTGQDVTGLVQSSSSRIGGGIREVSRRSRQLQRGIIRAEFVPCLANRVTARARISSEFANRVQSGWR